MKKITRSVIKLSEIPEHLQKDKIFDGHKIHTYAIFHIDDSEKTELSLWLEKKYPTIKRKIRFLIHIDVDIREQTYSEEEVLNFTQTIIMQYKFGNTNIEQMDLLKETLQLFKNGK